MDNSSSTASEFASSHFAAEVVDVQPLRVQSSLMLCALLRNLGFHGVIERWCGDDGEIPCSKVLEAYVHCRFNSSDPVPVSRFEEWLAKSCIPSLLGVPAAKLNESRLGRVLELVGKAPQAMWIELLSNAHRVFHLDLAYVINDTSAFYFEGEYETSDYARYGHSKDGKPECKQINVSLSVSGDHSIPLLYTPLAGNTSDTTTVIPNLQRLRGLFNELGCADARPVVIADKGLLTMRLIHYYRSLTIARLSSRYGHGGNPVGRPVRSS